MEIPRNPNLLLGYRVETKEGNRGRIYTIGNMSNEPYILFDDNTSAIHMKWSDIELVLRSKY